MLLLLAPSKTQDKIPTDLTETSQPQLLNQAQKLTSILQKKDRTELAELMKTSEKLTVATEKLIKNFSTPFTPANSHPAIFTFQGDVYSSLTPEVWNKEQVNHAQKHLAILSGLYGILSPLDLMQPYRLEMGLKLETERGKNMYQFWGDAVTEIINTQLASSENRTIINLASAEYFKVVNKKKLDGEIIEIVFRQEKENRLKTIPVYSKRARGAMANFVVMEKLDHPEQLKDFHEGGYSFAPTASTSNRWIFTCKLD